MKPLETPFSGSWARHIEVFSQIAENLEDRGASWALGISSPDIEALVSRYYGSVDANMVKPLLDTAGLVLGRCSRPTKLGILKEDAADRLPEASVQRPFDRLRHLFRRGNP